MEWIWVFKSYRVIDTTHYNHKQNKTEVTSVKLVLFKYVMSFETLTKVDQLTEIFSIQVWLSFKSKNSGKLWSGKQMITQNDV